MAGIRVKRCEKLENNDSKNGCSMMFVVLETALTQGMTLSCNLHICFR